MSTQMPPADTVATGQYEGAIKLGRRGKRSVYWHPQSNSVIHFNEEGIETGTTDMVTHLTSPVGDYLNESDRCGKCWEFSRLGRFFRCTSSFQNVRVITYREEMVYGISRYTEYSDETGANMLDISVETYRNHLNNAQRKVSCAFNIVEAIIN